MVSTGRQAVPGLIRRPPYELYPLSKFLIIFTFFTRIPGFKVLLPSIIPTGIPISPSIPTFRCTSASALAAGPSLALLNTPSPTGQLKQLEQFVRLVPVVHADKTCIRNFLSSAKLVHRDVQVAWSAKYAV